MAESQPPAPRPASPPRNRTPEEIRASIERNRTELAGSLVKLRGEIVELADWRKQIRRNRKQVIIGAAAAGFLIGGGIAALGGIVSRRRSS